MNLDTARALETALEEHEPLIRRISMRDYAVEYTHWTGARRTLYDGDTKHLAPSTTRRSAVDWMGTSKQDIANSTP